MRKQQYIITILGLVLCLGLGIEAHAEIKPHLIQKSQEGGQAAQQISAIKPVVANYDIYVGGLHLVMGEITFYQSKGHYLAHVKAQTQGFWYRIFPWNAEVKSEGHIVASRFLPVSYSDYNLWNKKPKTVSMSFDNKGMISTTFVPEDHDKNQEPVSPEQRRGSLDPASALLQMLANLTVTKSCAQTVPVFDGKRRFDLIGSDNGSDELDDSELGVYKGDVRLCDVTFTMIAGDWKEKDSIKGRFWQHSDGEKGREPFHIWLAAPAPGLPEMPVRLESTSFWGLVVIHLTGWRPAHLDELKP